MNVMVVVVVATVGTQLARHVEPASKRCSGSYQFVYFFSVVLMSSKPYGSRNISTWHANDSKIYLCLLVLGPFFPPKPPCVAPARVQPSAFGPVGCRVKISVGFPIRSASAPGYDALYDRRRALSMLSTGDIDPAFSGRTMSESASRRTRACLPTLHPFTDVRLPRQTKVQYHSVLVRYRNRRIFIFNSDLHHRQPVRLWT